MGQKTNANIFRLNSQLNREWKSKYKVATAEESSLFVYNDLQYRTYIKQFLNRYGLIFHDYKVYHSNSSIYIYISYFVTRNSLFHINNIKSDQKMLLQTDRTVINYQKALQKELPSRLEQRHFLKDSKFQKRLHLLKKYKKYLHRQNYGNKFEKQKNNFIEKLM